MKQDEDMFDEVEAIATPLIQELAAKDEATVQMDDAGAGNTLLGKVGGVKRARDHDQDRSGIVDPSTSAQW